MRSDIAETISPRGIYTAAQAIKATGISQATFYRYVRDEKIPKHKRAIDGKTVFLGKELLKALQETERIMPMVYIVKPRRGRPSKKIQANP